MAKKHWIYIKRGLSESPKHRAAMGECIWLYMHIIDRADWETGIAYDWKDREEAADMGMNFDTLRAQRQKLEKMDYIRCTQKQHSQDIRIMEWINPRDYSAGVVNPRNPVEEPAVDPAPPAPAPVPVPAVQGGAETLPSEGEAETLPSEFQGCSQDGSQDGIQARGQNPTPTLDSESESSSLGSGLSKKDLENANRLMDAILANAKKETYPNRDRIPESYLPYCDFYVEMVGKDPDGHFIQVPTQRVITDWIMTFEEWKQERLTREHIRAAWEHANRDGGFPVGRPGALTKTAVAMKTKLLSSPSAAPALNTAALEHTQKVIKEKTSGTFVPRPANLQKPALVNQSVKSLAERKGIRR
jgi:hypothetical protein